MRRVAPIPPCGIPHEPYGPIASPFPIPPLCRSVFTGLGVVGLAALCHAAPPAPQLRCDLASTGGVHLSQDGTAVLEWNQVEAASSFELEEAVPGNPSEFHQRYAGSDLASVRTGLAEGSHRFRVRALDAGSNTGEWSEPLVVAVEYMPRGRLILLLVLGGSVTIATVAAILHGHFTHRRKPVA